MRKPITWLFLFITILCFTRIVEKRWIGEDKQSWKTIIASDGYGYYAYLPYVFIYHKVDLESDFKAIKTLRPDITMSNLYEWIAIVDGKCIDKYFVGVAILEAPFFLMAYAASVITGQPVTGGYSLIFECAISIAALFYVLLGLVFIYKLLKEYHLSETYAIMMILLVLFGTNLLDYATMVPCMSHSYSFGMAALFLFYTKKSMDDPRLKYLVYAIISMSLLIIVRPTNILGVLIIPLLAGNYTSLKQYFTRIFSKKALIILFVCALSIISFQLYTWYAQTGHWLIWSYSGEGFDFSQPHVLDFLFSYRKGWFLYTPAMFVIITAGLIFLFNRNKFQFFFFALFLALVIFVLSSWRGWWYGSSFGQRPIIDFYPYFLLPFAWWISTLKLRWFGVTVYLVLSACLILNLIQTYQYDNQIISGDNMNKRKYWKIFLHTGDDFRYLIGAPEILASDYNFFDKNSVFNDFENGLWGGKETISPKHSHSGKYSAFTNKDRPYSPCFSDTVYTLPSIPQGKTMMVYINLWMYLPVYNNIAGIVVELKEKGSPIAYFWRSLRLWSQVENLNKWENGEFLTDLPVFKNKSDILSIYIYNTGDSVYIDDEEIKFGILKH